MLQLHHHGRMQDSNINPNTLRSQAEQQQKHRRGGGGGDSAGLASASHQILPRHGGRPRTRDARATTGGVRAVSGDNSALITSPAL